MTKYQQSGILRFMKILQARPQDIDSIMNIIEHCTADLQAQGIQQWNEHYPSRSILLEDIQAGDAYIATGDDQNRKLLGLIVVSSSSIDTDDQHARIKWLQQDGPALFLTRLAVDPDHQGSGIGTQLLDFGERCALTREAASIRLEVDAEQPVLIERYKKRGFQPVGTIWYGSEAADSSPLRKFLVLEKLVSSIDLHWADAGELPEILEIRRKVFVEEQGVDPKLEQDGLDDQAAHCVLRENGRAAGCARIRWQTREIETDRQTEQRTFIYWKIERLAVLPEARNRGYGKLMMEWIVREARTQDINKLTMHAQHQLIGFYSDIGFRTEGKPFLEAGIQHISMEMELPD